MKKRYVSLKLAILCIVSFLCFGVNGFGQTYTATTPGTGPYDWTAPCDVTSITLEIWGGGGGGQRAGGNPSAGGGGSGGGYVRTTYTVTPGVTYTVFAGTGGTGNFGGNGAASWFNSAISVLATGGRGAGGTVTGANTWGTGAVAFTTGNIGGTIRSAYGGNGGNAGNNFSGGGGSSGGTTASNNALGITGGAAPTNGYAGPNGVNPYSNGAVGNVGAGGSGGSTNRNTGRNGGAGGRGQVRITYTSTLLAYCTPTLFFLGDVEPITSVVYAGINNQTSAVVNGTPLLQSFCNTATVTVGSSNTITVKGNTAGNFTDYFTVFIDWDQDGFFGSAPNEVHTIGTINNSTGVDAKQIVYNISVPASATLGFTKMRIVKEFAFYADACGDFFGDIDFGQAEDYVVNVIACTGGDGTGITALACPSVFSGGLGLSGADPIAVDCLAVSTCVDLEATFLELGDTSSYRVEGIDYAPPYQYNCLANPVSVDLDDIWSPVVTLPFDFCFYNNTYTSIVVGSNGVLSFNNALATTPSGWRIDNNLPSNVNGAEGPANYFYGPSIFGVHHDIDPNIGGQIGWELITLNTGCRALVAAWHDVPMFDPNNFHSILYSGMIVLYENTNVIEVYIEEKNRSIDLGGGTYWNNARAQVGIQANAINGLAAPARNNIGATWTTNQEAWRFVPYGTSITDLKWYANSISPANEIIDPNDDGILNVCPTNTTTYFAEVTYNLCNAGGTLIESDQTTVTVNVAKVWDGSKDTNWYDDDNWTPAGIPDATDCVIVPNVTTSNNNSPIADVGAPGGTTALARTLNVNANGFLQLNANTFLEVTEAVTVDPVAGALPAGDFLIRSSGSLIQDPLATINNNSGNIRVQRTVPGGVVPANYVYWSSPVENFDVGNINTAASELRFQWEPTIGGLYGNWTAISGAMAIGRGYIVRGLATPVSPIPASTAQFTGTPSNGIINVPINRGTYTSPTPYAGASPNTMATNLDDNWNLVGNPYPSAISANSFLALNTAGPTPKIDGTIYLWSHTGLPSGNTTDDPFYQDFVYNYLGSSYVATNGVGSTPPNVFFGNIAAGQSFFVQMLDGAGTSNTVTFNNTMRSGAPANDNFLRSTGERHRIWLDLVDLTNVASSTLIGYVTDATNERDLLYDGYDLNDTSMKLYSMLGEGEMTIQGRQLPFEQDDRVPLGFIVPQSANYKIAINSLDGLFSDPSQNIYLEDTFTNTIHDLRIEPYTFASNSGTFNDRFILRYTNATLSTPEQVANFGFNIIGLKDYIKVTSSNNPINTVVVYDVLGRVLADYKDINALEFKLDFVNQSQGALIVKATLYNGQQKIKKVIY